METTSNSSRDLLIPGARVAENLSHTREGFFRSPKMFVFPCDTAVARDLDISFGHVEGDVPARRRRGETSLDKSFGSYVRSVEDRTANIEHEEAESGVPEEYITRGTFWVHEGEYVVGSFGSRGVAIVAHCETEEGVLLIPVDIPCVIDAGPQDPGDYSWRAYARMAFALYERGHRIFSVKPELIRQTLEAMENE